MSDLHCTKKFCPANSVMKYDLPTVDASISMDMTKMKESSKSNNNRPKKRNPVIKRTKKKPSVVKYQQRIAKPRSGNSFQATPETSKIRLIMSLDKLKDLGIEYSMISGYFKNTLTRLRTEYPDNRTITYTLEEILVFDREELKNSNQCYFDARTSIEKSSYIDFSVIHGIIQGLSDIVRDFT